MSALKRLDERAERKGPDFATAFAGLGTMEAVRRNEGPARAGFTASRTAPAARRGGPNIASTL